MNTKWPNFEKVRYRGSTRSTQDLLIQNSVKRDKTMPDRNLKTTMCLRASPFFQKSYVILWFLWPLKSFHELYNPFLHAIYFMLPHISPISQSVSDKTFVIWIEMYSKLWIFSNMYGCFLIRRSNLQNRMQSAFCFLEAIQRIHKV